MKKAFVAAVLAALGFAGYRFATTHGPEAQYQQFAEEILHRRYDAAAAMADGLSAADLEKLGSQERIGGGPPMFQQLFPSKFTIESKESAPDGSVTLRAMQTVLFNPVGVESAVRPAMFAKMRQRITMRKTSGAWKVTAFSNECETFDTFGNR